MAFGLENLLQCLNVTPDDGGWVGENLDLDYRRVFGGQLLAQSIRALQARATPGKRLKSFTQRFAREGDTAQPIHYEVDVRQDGRTFGSYDVTASQAGKLISTAAASLHVPEHGWERSDPMPVGPGPEDAVPTDIAILPWEIRIVDGVDLSDRSSRPADLQFWMRAATVPAALADDPWVHEALAAYATDLTMIGTALLPVEGVSQADTATAFHSAVTTHAMWFHGDLRIDEWLLVDQHSSVLSGGRAYGRGDIWSADGRLVASFAQEAMLRVL